MFRGGSGHELWVGSTFDGQSWHDCAGGAGAPLTRPSFHPGNKDRVFSGTADEGIILGLQLVVTFSGLRNIEEPGLLVVKRFGEQVEGSDVDTMAITWQ